MKPDKRQLRLFKDAPNRMEIKDHQKKKATRTPKRKGFASSADVHLGEEVSVLTADSVFVNAIVNKKNTDAAGSTIFWLIVEAHDGKSEGIRSCRLGELYRRMK